MKKRFLMLTLCVLLVLVSALALASCGDDKNTHTHAYVDTVTPATCTAEGYTTHTCSCGDSYTDTPTPVAPHAATTKILRYPTTLVKGQQLVFCPNCSYSVKEEINVITTFAMPGIADALASMLPQGSFVIDDCDSLPTLSLSKLLSKEVGNDAYAGLLTPTTSLEESTFALQLEDVEFSVEGENVTGSLVFNVLTYLEGSDTPTPVFSLAFYIANEDVSVAVNNAAPSNFKLSDKVYETIASMMDMSVAQLKEIFYLGSEAKNYLPLAESIANALVGELSKLGDIDVTGVMTILSLIGGDIVQAEAVGENTLYTVKLSAAIEALSTYEDKTLATILDEAFGAGTAASVTAFLTKMPDMTIGDIADAAIALSETYNIDLDRIYAIINGVVYNVNGADFDFESELYKQYDKTLLSLLTEGSEQTAAQIKEAIANAATAMTTLTVSDLVHLSSCTGDSEDAHNMEDCVLLSAALDSIAANLDENIVAEITVDAEGNIVALNTALAPFLAVSKTENDVLTITLALPERPATTFMLDLSVENQMQATLTVNGVEMVCATVVPGEGNCLWIADLTVKIPQATESEEITYTTLSYTVDAVYEEATGNVTLTLEGDEASAVIILDQDNNVLTYDISLPYFTAIKTENAIATVTISLPDRPVVCVTVDLSKAEEQTATLTLDGVEMAAIRFVPGANSDSFDMEMVLKVPTPVEGGEEGETVLKEYYFSVESVYDPEINYYRYIYTAVVDGQLIGFAVEANPNRLLVECVFGEDYGMLLQLFKNPDAPEIMIEVARMSPGEEPFDNFDLQLFLAENQDGFSIKLKDALGEIDILEIVYAANLETGNASLTVSGMVNLALIKTTEEGVITYTFVNTETGTTLVTAVVSEGELDLTFNLADRLTGGITLSCTESNGSMQFTVECTDLTVVSAKEYEEIVEIDAETFAFYDVTDITTCVLDGILSFTVSR